MPVDRVTAVSARARSLADTARVFGGSVLDAAAKRKDPRAKHLRKIRRARSRGIRFGTASATSAAGTAGMALLSAPEWTLLVGGGGAALFAVPAGFALARLRVLKARPVPIGMPVKRILPPRNSAAHEPMVRLAGAERSLYELLGILSRSESIRSEELEETVTVASDAVLGLSAVATDIAAMERAGASSAATRDHVRAGIDAAAADLAAGVRQYEDLVGAAARMTGPVGSTPSSMAEVQRMELLSATDRLQGWADALEEIAEIRSRHP